LTVTPDGGSALTTKTITKYGGIALTVGDLPAGMKAVFVYDGTNFELLNPASASGDSSWTPAFTSATAGDLTATASTALGSYVKIGRTVYAEFTLLLSTFTHSTASGNATITGWPFNGHSANVFGTGSVDWGGITKSGFTDINLRVRNDSTAILIASASGQASAVVTASDMPSVWNRVLPGIGSRDSRRRSRTFLSTHDRQDRHGDFGSIQSI